MYLNQPKKYELEGLDNKYSFGWWNLVRTKHQNIIHTAHELQYGDFMGIKAIRFSHFVSSEAFVFSGFCPAHCLVSQIARRCADVLRSRPEQREWSATRDTPPLIFTFH